MADVHPAMRAELDQELSGALDGLVLKAAEHDAEDLIEANAALTDELLALLGPRQLATAAAGLALRLRRMGGA